VVTSVVVWSGVAAVPTTFNQTGYFRPYDGVWPMEAPISGLVRRFNLAEGQTVKVGTSLAEISPAGGGAPVSVPCAITGVVTEVDAGVLGYVTAGQIMAVVNPTLIPVVVYTFAPTGISSGIESGLAVHVLFGGGVGARYGFALGYVYSISVYPPTQAYISWLLPEIPVGVIGPVGLVNTVVIGLTPDRHTPSGVTWVSGQGPAAKLSPGLPCTVTLLLGSHHPIDDIL
jgi:hypothetical protein